MVPVTFMYMIGLIPWLVVAFAAWKFYEVFAGIRHELEEIKLMLAHRETTRGR